MSLGAKVLAVTLLWVFLGYSAVFVVDSVWLRVLLLIIALAVTVHILHLPTLTRQMLADLEESNAFARPPRRRLRTMGLRKRNEHKSRR